MTSFPNSPSGIVLIDPVTSKVRRIIALQHNPYTIYRILQVPVCGVESDDRSELSKSMRDLDRAVIKQSIINRIEKSVKDHKL